MPSTRRVRNLQRRSNSKPTFSIITTSKSRRDHLKISLPQMLKQMRSEVIVVDYSCPQGTAEYVKEHFPEVRIVAVEGRQYFSNWDARNLGASVAAGNVLVFCDADTLLAGDAVDQLDTAFATDAFGMFEGDSASRLGSDAGQLSPNQARGFQVIPANAFRRAGGYDEVLEGYASGGEIELAERLLLMGIRREPLPTDLIQSIIEHDDSARLRHHLPDIRTSYGAGLVYRRAKQMLLRATRRRKLPLPLRRQLYDQARIAVEPLGSDRDAASLRVKLGSMAVGMPRQLGFSEGALSVSLNVTLSMAGKL